MIWQMNPNSIPMLNNIDNLKQTIKRHTVIERHEFFTVLIKTITHYALVTITYNKHDDRYYIEHDKVNYNFDDIESYVILEKE